MEESNTNTEFQLLTTPKRKRKSNAEYCKKYRSKKVKTEAERQIESARVAEYRRKLKDSPTKLLAAREKERKRKMLYRKKKSEATHSPDTPMSVEKISNSLFMPFKKPQSLGKAVQRLARNLPSSPRRQKAAVSGLAKRIGVNLMENFQGALDNSQSSRGTSKETIDLVANFYVRSDIVYTQPGMKDEMVIWENGVKRRERKYYLTLFLREAHSIYLETHPDNPIGRAKFCDLRPKNVLLLSQTPADQCRCMVHDNFRAKLQGLSINYSDDFWGTMLCDSSYNSKCWQLLCDNCKNGQMLTISLALKKQITWREWCFVDQTDGDDDETHETQKKKKKKILRSLTKDGCVAELMELIRQDYPRFVLHVNTKRIQQKEFQKDLKDENVRTLQVDFAMNYSCEYQDEVQSALWGRGSVTLFTAAVVQPGCECKTFLICSDTKDKGKDTVAVFINHLYENYIFMEECSATQEVIWSDGPTSEFKNRFMVKFIKVLNEKYNRNVTWKFSATSHGKGVVDGIGGGAKSIVRQKVMSKNRDRIIVQNSKDFAAAAGTLLEKTTVIHMSTEEITTKIEELISWDNTAAVPGILNKHIVSYTDGSLKLLNNAESEAGKYL